MQFKYERLGDLYFTCGVLSHTERFHHKKLEGETHISSILKESFTNWLCAPPRQAAIQVKSK